ncbi:MAG: hypothetical protein IIA06_12505 [Proteobacteria bacterium]|nr:hypothetical protein [Pseudomonadota bacterium]
MNTTRPVYKIIDLIKIHWSLLLILSTAFLFATKTSFNIPFYIMIAVLPYNAGSAFYGSYWSSLTWWIILISACFVFSSQNKGI